MLSQMFNDKIPYTTLFKIRAVSGNQGPSFYTSAHRAQRCMKMKKKLQKDEIR
jgi:hypothetical protein